jgi:hypothetical protein
MNNLFADLPEELVEVLTENQHVRIERIVSNPLYETRLHGLHQGDEIIFHEDHILHVHDTHRQELVVGMDVDDLKELAQWLGSHRE